MQIYAINGSPRKKWNTATLLQNVLDGAAEAEDDVLGEMINLYDYSYKGCVSCFECKRTGGPSYGKCAVKDEIQPVLRNVLNADAVVFGSPIYFAEITGMTRCFLERLLFPCLVYAPGYPTIAPKKLYSAFVYDMNVTAETMEQNGYRERLKSMESYAARMFGHEPRVLFACDTLQTNDYGKYQMTLFSEADKKKSRELQFPLDCKKARELGAALVADVRGEPVI